MVEEDKIDPDEQPEDFPRTDSFQITENEGAEKTEVAESTLQPGQAIDAPDQLGPYKLLHQIGEGGMGTVWLAEQQEPVRRRVAVKLIKSNFSSKEILARFEAERQALAMMDHQNICRVFDARSTEDGIPYFVMELVNGVPITKYCNDNQLSILDRLKLFVPVCKAIQHAHQKGIIHRDLKPSNVLVTQYDGEAVPKVIDFGLAKATEYALQLTDQSMFTEFGKIVGTLRYMSPEQAEMNSLIVDTRTDIYSLGVMLYELLTGSTPIDKDTLGRNALLQILDIIREKDPQKPSDRISDSGDAIIGISDQRKIAPPKLQQALKGDLDWLVMKALEKNRNRRYETANGLAEDIRRYLADEPISARPPSTMYRIGKYAKKHRSLVASGCLLFAMLLVSSIAMSMLAWSAIKSAALAEERSDESEEALQMLAAVFDNLDVQGIRDSGLTVDDALNERIVGMLPSIRAREFNNLSTEATVKQGFGEILLGLGEPKAAKQLFEESLEIQMTTTENDSQDLLRGQIGLSRALAETGELEEAISLAEQANQLSSSINAIPTSLSLKTKKTLFQHLSQTGNKEQMAALIDEWWSEFLQQIESVDDESLVEFAEIGLFALNGGLRKPAIELLDKVADQVPQDSGLSPILIARVFNILGHRFLSENQPQKAINWLSKAQQIVDVRGWQSLPIGISVLNNLAESHQRLGNSKRAIGMFETAISLSDRANMSGEVITAKNNLARCYVFQNRIEEGISLFKECIAIMERLNAQADPKYLGLLNNLVHAQRKSKTPEDALDSIDKSFEVRADLLGIDAVDTVRTLRGKGRILTDLGRIGEAMEVFSKVLDSEKSRHPLLCDISLETLERWSKAEERVSLDQDLQRKLIENMQACVDQFDESHAIRMASLIKVLSGPEFESLRKTLQELSDAISD